ncbi:hypothetical protein TNIN_421491 [Trichonephila inaurata madagascariensis]|uniref:Uncharacterized protein n=1 Tax=Trichonephila inaurata madagascariensis TaxID=2747483 RepID=A0A8X6X471_9ARAC|nr:hypothetical protein TNIN_421491 [Trichonephila inaurata madagascariensis]
MNFVQSLEHLAAIRLAISIHNSSEFLESKEKFGKSCDSFDMFPVKQVFREILLKSVIPNKLCEKLLGIIKPISKAIDIWKAELADFGVRTQTDICLTSSGTIDRVGTAKKFVRSEDQKVVERFALACHFWMTDDVLKMWNKASVDERIRIERKLLHPKNSFYWMSGRWHRRTAIHFESLETIHCLKKWFDWLHDGGDPCKLHKFVDASVLAFTGTIPEPTLLRALPQEILRQLIKSKYDFFTGRAYFSSLDYNQKLSFFQKEPLTILRDYLKWPLQDKFLEMACQAWEYLTESLLHEFWKQSPHHLKISAKEHRNWQRNRVKLSEEDRGTSPLQRLLDKDPIVVHHKTTRRRIYTNGDLLILEQGD